METYGTGRYYLTAGAVYRYANKVSAIWFARKLSRDWQDPIRVYDSHTGERPHKCVATYARGKKLNP